MLHLAFRWHPALRRLGRRTAEWSRMLSGCFCGWMWIDVHLRSLSSLFQHDSVLVFLAVDVLVTDHIRKIPHILYLHYTVYSHIYVKVLGVVNLHTQTVLCCSVLFCCLLFSHIKCMRDSEESYFVCPIQSWQFNRKYVSIGKNNHLVLFCYVGHSYW